MSGGLALPAGAKKTGGKRLPFIPEQHDFAVPARACPHISGIWGTGIQIPELDLMNKPQIRVEPYTGINYSGCHRKCGKFLPDPEDDPTDKKQGGAKGRCADLVSAIELLALRIQLGAVQSQLPATQNNEARTA